MQEYERTSVNVSRPTKERLRKRGEKDESYESIIANLLDATAKGYEDQRKTNKETDK